MSPITSSPSLFDTVAGLVRLVLVLVAVPAVLAGAIAATMVLVAGAPFVLASRAVREFKRAASSPRWAAA